jgi:hypothetical protein
MWGGPWGLTPWALAWLAPSAAPPVVLTGGEVLRVPGRGVLCELEGRSVLERIEGRAASVVVEGRAVVAFVEGRSTICEVV